MSDILQGDLYQSGTSSNSYDNQYTIQQSSIPSLKKSVKDELEKKVREQEQSTQQIYNKFKISSIVISKTFVPIQTLKKKEELLEKIKNIKLQQTTLNQESLALDVKISQVKAELQSSSKIQQLLKSVNKASTQDLNMQKLKQKFDKYSLQESDLEIEAKLLVLDKELELKRKSQSELTAFLKKKIEYEKQSIQNLKKRRKAITDRLEDEYLMNNQISEQTKKAKDRKLIEDRTKMLQQCIKTLKEELQMN